MDEEPSPGISGGHDDAEPDASLDDELARFGVFPSDHDAVWGNTTATAADPIGATRVMASTVETDEPVDVDPEPPVRSTGSRTAAKSTMRVVREWLTVLVVALGAAVVIRVFVFQQYYIDGPSMRTTLEPHDRVLVNKLSYRLHDVNRGDVVVFDRVTDNGSSVQHDDLIKRVIALEGETIEIRSCDVYIDGRRLEEPYLSTESQVDANPQSRCGIPDVPAEDVPDGEVYVMGDNRAYSFDSRQFGPIDVDLIRGRAFVVIWPAGSWRWL